MFFPSRQGGEARESLEGLFGRVTTLFMQARALESQGHVTQGCAQRSRCPSARRNTSAAAPEGTMRVAFSSSGTSVTSALFFIQ